MRLTNILFKKVKAKRIMVVVESMVSGHKYNTVRERLGDKVETIRFDPYIQKEAVYRELKKIRSVNKEVHRGSKMYLYADHLVLTGNCTSELGLGIRLDNFFTFLILIDYIKALLINPSISKAMLFGIMSPQLNILIGGFVDIYKCLGIFTDHHRTFEKHIEFAHGKAVGILRSTYSNNTYLPQLVKYRLACALLMQQILYGQDVMAGATPHSYLVIKSNSAATLKL
uniref:Large ribosomal subunit protein bL33m n=1 Tax=Glossina pallidipes TaxID=7398 RepID=A0A1A9ZVD7_GLOPL